MQPPSAVSRPAWVNAMNAITGTGGAARRSPVEIFATAASAVARSPYAEVTGIRHGRLGRWTDGVAAMRADRVGFAAYWEAHNERVLAERAARPDPGPLWAVLGDSTAQGLGAPGPQGGYVGQALRQLRRRSGRRWQVVNLSVSGCLIRDVLAGQLPRLAGCQPDLVTCGAGANDILYSSPARLFADLRALLAAVPAGTVLLDLPLLTGFWWIAGRISVPYITRINRVIHEVAAERALPVALVSEHFTAPWAGKFGCDSFHPSQDGYRDWTRALLAAVPGSLQAGPEAGARANPRDSRQAGPGAGARANPRDSRQAGPRAGAPAGSLAAGPRAGSLAAGSLAGVAAARRPGVPGGPPAALADAARRHPAVTAPTESSCTFAEAHPTDL